MTLASSEGLAVFFFVFFKLDCQTGYNIPNLKNTHVPKAIERNLGFKAHVTGSYHQNHTFTFPADA